MEMLRNLCPVSPSMYYVGVTKVPTPKMPPGWARRSQRRLEGQQPNWGGSHGVPPPKLFLKEQLYQALESKRARAHHLAALTLQRYARTFFIKRRFRSLRRKIVLLQSRARGYLARWGPGGHPGGVSQLAVARGDGGALPQAAVPAHEAHAHQVQVVGAHLREPPAVPQGERGGGTARGGHHPHPEPPQILKAVPGG